MTHGENQEKAEIHSLTLTLHSHTDTQRSIEKGTHQMGSWISGSGVVF